MNNDQVIKKPVHLESLLKSAHEMEFVMSCDLDTGQLLRTLAGAKTNSRFLELGTGVGASTSWILAGMDNNSSLITVEMDEKLHRVGKKFLDYDPRVTFVTVDGGEFIKANKDKKFDFIFADTWPGKFYLLEETLDMVAPGGMYIIDDLTIEDHWSQEHVEKVNKLIHFFESTSEFYVTCINWSTGLIIATRK